MARERVLRIRVADQDQGEFVLVNVKGNGSAPLDLKLLGTEGENPYVGIVKQRQISKLRATNFAGSDELWEAALRHVLLQEPIPGVQSKDLEGLDVVATVTEASQISVVVRKNISGITQRLGSVSLTLNEGEEIALFDWAGAAAEATSSALADLANLRRKYADQKEAFEKLSEQLDDLIKAKAEHENALIEKFRLLLNSKKMKIRDQQRLLVTAGTGRAAAEQVQPAAGEVKSRKPGPSRASKRKASQKVEPVQSESDDDGFERVSAAGKENSKDGAVDQDEDMADLVTPEKSEGEETTDSGEVEPAAQAAQKARGSRPEAASQKAPQKPDSPPPRRELPFARRATRSKQTGSPEAQPASGKSAIGRGEESEDEDEDDEL